MEAKVCKPEQMYIKIIKTRAYISFSPSCAMSFNNQHKLIWTRNELDDSHTQTELQPLEHLPRLSKNPRFLLISLNHPAISKLLPTNWAAACSKLQHNCRCTGHRDFNPQYATLHYSAHYMQRAIPIMERTPCRKFLHRSLNFQVYTLFLFVTAFLHDSIVVLLLLTKWKWGLWFSEWNRYRN